MKEEKITLKPCPFCGSHNLRYSVSVASRTRTSTNYHLSITCKDCFCIGKRILITTTENKISDNVEYRKLAENAWNERV